MKRLTNLIEPTNVIIVSDAYINGDRIVCRSGNDDFDLWAKDLKKASVIMEFTGIDAHKPVQDMTVKEAAEILRKHNEWRRYDGPIGEGPQMQDPALIGKAIDTLTVPIEPITIDDLEVIHTFLYAVKNNKTGCFTFTRLSDEQYKEVLRRFNQWKEERK